MRLQSLASLLFSVVLPLQGQELQSATALLSGALRKSGLPEDQESVTLQLKSTFSGLIVEVNIDAGVAHLILDTGATYTILTEGAADRLRLKAMEGVNVDGSDSQGMKLAMQPALTKRITLGKAWTENEPVMIAELPKAFGDGALGLSTLADWDVRIHPAENTLTLFPAGKANPLKGDTVLQLDCELVNPEASSSNPQGLRGLNLHVPVRLGGHVVAATPDTGFGGTLQLPSVLMIGFASEAMQMASPALAAGISASGIKASRIARVPEFSFGSDTLLSLPVEVVDAQPGMAAERRGIVGLNLLRHYVMTFRFSAGELRLQSLGTVQDVTRTSTAGMNLGLDDGGRFIILSVMPEGPAAKAGIRAGDELLEIEGRPLKTMKPDEFATLKQLPPGTNVKARYRRGEGEPVEVTFALTKE